MHEYFDVEEYHRFLVVQAQVALFIFGYHGYLGVQSLWQCVVASIAILWLTNEITHITSVVAAILGLVLGLLVVYVTRIKHDKIHYHQVFYFLLQPAVFYYTMRLYADQTMYPVGIPLSFLLWLAMNMAVWGFSTHNYSYYMSLAVPVCSIFFFSWLIDKIAWVALGVTCGITLLYLIVILGRRRIEKINRKK